MRRFRLLLVALIVLPGGLLASCSSTVPATVTMQPQAPLDPEARVFVSAVRQRGRIVESLRDAGVELTDDVRAADYQLQVKVGSTRSRRECGTVNNVSYVLTQGRGRLLIIKGRGPTGNCTPSTFDDLSGKLASYQEGGD